MTGLQLATLAVLLLVVSTHKQSCNSSSAYLQPLLSSHPSLQELKNTIYAEQDPKTEFCRTVALSLLYKLNPAVFAAASEAEILQFMQEEQSVVSKRMFAEIHKLLEVSSAEMAGLGEEATWIENFENYKILTYRSR